MAKPYKTGIGAATPKRECMACNLVRLVQSGLVLILAVTLVMTQTHQFVCVSCVDRGMFVMPYPTLRAVRTHIGKSLVCRAAGLGVKEVELETWYRRCWAGT